MADNLGDLIVDVDGTLCPVKRPGERYEDLVPYHSMIEALRMRQAEGFRIVLHTARNVRTHNGELGLINRHTLPALMDWVERWDIPCDAVIVGKPWPGQEGYYVDDRAVRPSEFLSKSHAEITELLSKEKKQHERANIGMKTEEVNIVITMAGRGSRFRAAGYTKPKYEIEVGGRTLFDWSMLSLKQFLNRPHKLIFVILGELDAEAFVRKACSENGLDLGDIIQLAEVTDGQATSALAAKEIWNASAPLLIYNIDTFVEPQALRPFDIQEGADAWAPCFLADGDHWSFIRIGEDGCWAVEVAEKRRISENATIGLYWFSSASLYESLYNEHFMAGGEEAGERYIAPLYNTLINRGGRLGIATVPLGQVHPLGTPDEVKAFRPPRDLARAAKA